MLSEKLRLGCYYRHAGKTVVLAKIAKYSACTELYVHPPCKGGGKRVVVNSLGDRIPKDTFELECPCCGDSLSHTGRLALSDWILARCHKCDWVGRYWHNAQQCIRFPGKTRNIAQLLKDCGTHRDQVRWLLMYLQETGQVATAQNWLDKRVPPPMDWHEVDHLLGE